MGKNILVISTSLRSNSNSEALADAFMGGVNEAGEIEGYAALKKSFEMGKSVR